MKSRTSFFNSTVFVKNLTRFAPLWGLYTVGLVMCLILMANNGVEHWLYDNIAESLNLMPLANMGYALLCAQLLFGDLYSTRMCNMLHAMPVRREGWFLTNLLSGFVFSLFPTAVMALGAVFLSPFSEMINAWQIPLYWFLASNLQFLCFFGLAVFSAFCAGNRFAQATIYGILNFGVIIAYWMADTLYTPLFYGVATKFEPFQLFSPFVYMIEGQFIDCTRILDQEYMTEAGNWVYIHHGEFTLDSDWWYLWVCAAVGVALMLVALQMYRRRKLESAGDFMAIRGLEPVFQVVYTLIVGCVFQFVVDDMFGLTQMPLFLVVGLGVGWFTGRMLLERSTRVFYKKSWLGFLATSAVFALTLVVAAMDPFGVETWLPKAEEVESVTVSTDHGSYHNDEITLEDTADIEVILGIHEEAFTQRIDRRREITVDDVVYETIPVTIRYKLKDGSTKTRYYYVWANKGKSAVLRSYFSAVESIFGTENPDLDAILASELGWGYYWEEMGNALEHADTRSLLEAIIADCQAGTMAQHYVYGRGYVDLFNVSISLREVEKENGRIITARKEISIHSGNENCVRWLEELGVDVQAVIAEGNG